MITTLLWDLDNTLLDFPSAERQALIATFADFTLGPCSPDLLVRYSALNARWWRRLEEGDVTKAELLPGRFREFFAAEGIACTEYDAFNAAYQHHLGDTIVFLDNGYELVKDLHGQVKQYLVTNGSLQAQTRKLKRSGLGELFDGVFISEVVGAEKPSRAFFDAVLSHRAGGQGGAFAHRRLPHQRHGRGLRGGHPLLLVRPQGPAGAGGPAHPPYHSESQRDPFYFGGASIKFKSLREN